VTTARPREDGHEADRPRPRGRPRDAERHRAVVAAAVAVICEGGYEGLSITEVARRANVGRALIYKWWPTKAHLAAEALFARDERAPRRYVGPFAADLRALVTEMVEHLARPEVRLGLPGLTVDIRRDPALRAIGERWTAVVRSRYRTVFEAGVAAGDVRPDVAVDDLFDTIEGAALFHVQRRPDRPVGELVDHLVGLVLASVAVSR
jgi:AcrR family transcriptional regulator